MKLTTSQPDPSKTITLTEKNILERVIDFFKPITLPVLLAVIPTLYHYGNNVEKLILTNLWRMLVFNAVLAVMFYFVIGALNSFHPVRTALATSIFLVFFNVYGIVYRYLIHLDVIRIKHYTVLPLMLMLAAYAMLPVRRLSNSALVKVWTNLLLIVGVLVFYNMINILPAEALKWKSESTTASLTAQENALLTGEAPDIYYIIFDEFAGFQAMREYWGYHEVDDFVSFLKARGFFVAEESYASSTDTLHQMVTRLNYQEYPFDREHLQTYFNDTADNRVLHYLKSRGYTTVVFDETNLGYPSSKSMNADYVYEYGSSAIPQEGPRTYGLYFDEFGELVIDNTMVYAISQRYTSNNPTITLHSNMIRFTVEHVADADVSSPKFVYVHLLIPHTPFAFSEDGSILESNRFTNWNYYLDNYKFSIKIAREMINRILSQADPNNPPVIILQSDHGARNGANRRAGSATLPNYPEKFKAQIMYALLLPGYDYSALPQDIDPINTFPIVFNHVFNDTIPLYK